MNTVPWLYLLLKRFPQTHPHEWADLELIDYEGLIEGMPIDQWVKLDNELFSRECQILGCDQPAHGRMEEYSDFDPSDYIPEGQPIDWTPEEWTAYNECCNMVSKQTEELLNTEIAARVNNGVPDSEANEKQAKRAARMVEFLEKPTDQWELEDWAILKAYLEDQLQDDRQTVNYAEPTASGKGGGLVVVQNVGNVTKAESKCNCNGPGSKNQKHPTHISSCPEWEGGSNKPPKGSPCSCQGPGSVDKDGKPNEKYQDHISSCPQHKDYDPNKTYSTGSYSYSTCTHDREAKPFKLMNDLEIKALAYRDVKHVDDEGTDIGVYLYNSWWWYGSNTQAVKLSPDFKVQPAWMKKVGKPAEKEPLMTQQVVLDWPDFNIPKPELPMVDIVKWMLHQLEKGKKLETACMGGHGRTGTMLALLLVAQGMAPGSAMARVRKYHCSKAIENEKQGQYIVDFYKMVHGHEDWKKVKSQRKLVKQQLKAGHKDGKTSTKPKGSTNPVKPTEPPKPVYDKELQLWLCDRYIQGYHYDKESKTYFSKEKDGEKPVWNEEAKLWFRMTYAPGYKHDNKLGCYTSPHKNGEPVGAGTSKGGVN